MFCQVISFLKGDIGLYEQTISKHIIYKPGVKGTSKSELETVNIKLVFLQTLSAQAQL